MEINKIYQGDTLAVLRTFPDECIDMICTSPPYYGLRDYGVEGQTGLEPTLNEYLEKMLEVTAELRRVLKKTGTMWWNHGDSYGGTGDKGSWKDPKYPEGRNGQSVSLTKGIHEKSLLLQNFRLSIRMVDEQKWILRNTIIWHKPNCMPSSAKDRFTVDYEPVFFFTKSKKYWFEQQYEELAGGSEARANRAWYGRKHSGTYAGLKTRERGEDVGRWAPKLGRNKRCVWKIPTKGFSGAHFAIFPEKLIEPMIKAGCPEGGIILDCFMGSGTTAVVARKLGRNYIGIEINPQYIEIAERRLAQGVLLPC